MKKWVKKSFCLLLSAAMLLGLMPWLGTAERANAAGGYEDVLVNGTKLYNQSTIHLNPSVPNDAAYEDGGDASEYDAFIWFQRSKNSPIPGVFFDMDDKDDLYGTDKVDDDLYGTITVSQIPGLKQLAESGQGEFRFFARNLYESDDDYVTVGVSTSTLGTVLDTDNGEDNADTGWRKLSPNDVLTIDIVVDGTATLVGVHLFFRDITAPTVKDYIFNTTGTEHGNSTIDENELFLKWGDDLSLTYPFSEPLKAYSSVDALDLNRHDLFMNPAGTGLPAAGQKQGMKLPDTTSWGNYTDRLSYTYQATNYQHTGNLPIMNGGELTALAGGTNLNEKALKQKLIDADFHDAAGNPLIVSNFAARSASDAGSSFIRGKAINPFDSAIDAGNTNDGYRVIVDAVPPKYSFTANGVQPDIVTGSTLNAGDTIDFKVQLTEETIAKQGLSASGLFLHFNNGMKAYYIEGENSKVWTFRATVTEDDLDVALLKVIALTHQSRASNTPPYADKGVLQDYAGNLLTDAVNTSKSSPAPTDPSAQVANTKIDWAQLSIDNADPSFSYIYDADGATSEVWGKRGKITIDANDPDVIAPSFDPTEAGTVRPSRGIYRPLNMTGGNGNSPGVGLVYYYWSQSPVDPLAGKEADQFAAIKRYTLTGQQPRQGLYPGELPNFNLMVTNNKTNLLEPPSQALTAANSGVWYLHTWTADMTWETARELMQYEKMKTYKTNNAAAYNGWIADYWAANPSGSDADAEVYAGAKVLAAVGDYSDLTLWTAADFKHDDSNWIYSTASIRLDNEQPQLSAAISGVNDTAEVKATVTASDAHSGLDTDKLLFQWVKPGAQPGALDWTTVPSNRVVTTLNHVIEDGEYVLYLKAADMAGNTAQYVMTERALVNSASTVSISLSPEGSEEYVQSGDIAVSVSGANIKEILYAFSLSAARPADSQFKKAAAAAAPEQEPVTEDLQDEETVTESVYGDETSSVTESVYGSVPADYTLNGAYYLHVRAKEEGTNRYYEYNSLYRFDNAAPEAAFSVNGVSYARPAHSVIVTATELYNPEGMSVYYQWVQEGMPVPDETSSGWLPLPDDGKVAIASDMLSPGETARFTLYVYSQDGLGNSAVTGTNPFKLYRADDTPVTVLQSDLIAFSGDEASGYKATIQVELQSVSKDGFEYAISKDNGASWSVWKPYTNYVQTSVNESNPLQLKLKVKFRSQDGIESGVVAVDTLKYSEMADVLYGIASYSTLKPVKGGGLSLSIAVAAGIKVVPSATNNPDIPERIKGNSFAISQNGVYVFDLTDLTAPERTGKLLAVVKNVDNTAPEGSIEFNITATTRANVTAKLSTSEPVRILNNDGRSSYVFKDNGHFTFEFEDEAGNVGTATATVSNIDRTPPSVRLTQTYAKGTAGDQYVTIKDNNGQVVLAEGVNLIVEKTDAAEEDFFVVKGKQSNALLENGDVEIVVQDRQGNTTVLEETVSHLAPKLKLPEITYSFVDNDGNPLTDDKMVTINGKAYARGQVKVTLSGKVDAPNQVFLGMVPVSQGAGGNKISNDDGTYTHSTFYQSNGRTRIVLTDLLNRRIVSSIEVDGLDNTAPEIVLGRPIAAVAKNQEGFDPLQSLGGYTATDNVSASDNLTVTISPLDLSQVGRHTVVYTVTDEVGNQTSVTQQVIVMDNSGLLITGNGQVLSSSLQEKALFDTNRITFNVSGYDKMDVNGEELINEKASFTLLYYSGLYREGQMKYIAEELTLEELMNNQYQIVFPKSGWYTLIVRTQEREREFVSFFVGNTDQ
ncbi:hypothetical protein [Paenibacillus sp. YIM B09110]|uniref:hypothetical protein n=1 Tax=Paenibacillus sp. YIM B09110 TaxID=3126102 RepID=UPI00301DBA9A